MAKVIKDREDFVNENYYETSSTMVPGAGVGAGLFNGASGVTEKDVPQMGANGISNDNVATNAKPPIIIIKPMNQIDYNLKISH